MKIFMIDNTTFSVDGEMYKLSGECFQGISTMTEKIKMLRRNYCGRYFVCGNNLIALSNNRLQLIRYVFYEYKLYTRFSAWNFIGIEIHTL